MLIALFLFYVSTLGLVYFMVLRVNRNLPRSRRIRFLNVVSRGDWARLSWADWTRLPTEYKTFYPRSILYRLAVSGGITMLVIAMAMFALRFWEYAKHIP
jgi:hypothetical protein